MRFYPFEIARAVLQQRSSPAALRALQDRKLRRLVRHAAARVPYYRSLFDRAGIIADDIRGIEDLTRLPITTKAMLRDAGPQATVAQGLDLNALKVSRTNGTTGEPLTVYASMDDDVVQRAIVFRTFLTWGMRPRDHIALVGPPRQFPTRLINRLGLYRITTVPETSVDLMTQALRRRRRCSAGSPSRHRRSATRDEQPMARCGLGSGEPNKPDHGPLRQSAAFPLGSLTPACCRRTCWRSRPRRRPDVLSENTPVQGSTDPRSYERGYVPRFSRRGREAVGRLFNG